LQTLECIIGFYVIALGACVRVWAYALLFMLRILGQMSSWWSKASMSYLRFIFLAPLVLPLLSSIFKNTHNHKITKNIFIINIGSKTK